MAENRRVGGDVLIQKASLKRRKGEEGKHKFGGEKEEGVLLERLRLSSGETPLEEGGGQKRSSQGTSMTRKKKGFGRN